MVVLPIADIGSGGSQVEGEMTVGPYESDATKETRRRMEEEKRRREEEAKGADDKLRALEVGGGPWGAS